MPVTEKVSYTFTPETLAQIAELSKLCGGIQPAPKSHIIAEAVRRMWADETRRAKMKGKKS